MDKTISFFKLSSILLTMVMLAFCTNPPRHSTKAKLIKLTEDEKVERIKNGVFAEPEKVIYLTESFDTISYDSILRRDQKKPIALDEYVDKSGIIVQAIVRDFTEADERLKQRSIQAFSEYQMGEISGSIKTEIIKSEYLNEERILNIYIPKGINETTPIIYQTDGGYDNMTIKEIDEFISNKQMMPIILVGVPSSRDNRYQEYVFNKKHATKFEDHMQFFIKEVIEHVEQNILSMPRLQENRYIAGNSNGGDFSIMAALKSPNLFNEAISFSGVGLRETDLMSYKNMDKKTTFYIGAGTKETETLLKNEKVNSILKEQGFTVEFIKYNSGHDSEMWKEQFLIYCLNRFKK